MKNFDSRRGASILAFVTEKEANPGMPMPMDPAMGGAPMPMDPAMGGMPPMDPAMMGGMPPMDPAMMGGMPPMDPAMMGGMPPMDPAMGGMPPMDPAMGGMPPMDPAMGGMPPVDPAQVPEGMDVGQDDSNEIIKKMSDTIAKLTESVATMSERLDELVGDKAVTGEAEVEETGGDFESLLEDDLEEDLSPIGGALPEEDFMLDAQDVGEGDSLNEEQMLEDPETASVVKEASASSDIQSILKRHGIIK